MNENTTRLELGSERLESRRMLAGNVAVTQNAADDVLVVGDSADNVIQFSISNGAVVVSGINTTINGQNGPVELSDTQILNGNLTIRTRGGDDDVLLDQILISGRTRIDTGGGDDAVISINSVFEAELEIRAGGGLDQLTFDHGGSSSAVSLNMGAGDDLIGIDGVQWLGGMSINNGGGNDYVLVNESNVESFTEIQGGGGDDYVELSGYSSQGEQNLGIQVSLSSGDDEFRMNEFGYLDGDLSVSTAGGNDLISLHTLGMHGDVSFSTGGGSDVVAVVNTSGIDTLDLDLGAGNDGFLFGCSRADASTIQAGGGADLLLLGGEVETMELETAGGADTVVLNRFAAIDALNIDLGGGNDQLFTSRLSILPDNATANGGAGSDTVQWDSDLDWQVPLESFEINPAPAPLDDVVLGGIFVFATAWSEHGGLAGDLIC